MADYLVHVRDTEHISQAMLPDYHEIQPFVGKIIEQGHQIEETIQTLQHERNTVQLMLENMEEGVLLADGEGRLVVVNASAAQILHCARPDEALGICITELLPEVKLEVSPQAEAAHRDLLEKDGNIYHVRVRPIINDGQNYGTLVMLSDITEMEQREQFRREFTSNVSHELKTPLTSIRGFAEMLAAGMYGKKADVAHFGKRICQESQRLLHLIESIIALTHIEEVRRDAVHGPVELRPIIEDVVSFMEPVTVEEKVELHLELTDAVVRGNAAMLREMVMNLIDNAVKYNRAGGHVYVKMQADEGSLRFSVQDTGIGIPPEKQKRVFERFYRVEGSRNKKSGGSGLGLSIVKHIVLQHQGRISLQSQAGLGTTIEVILPLYDGQGLPPEARPVSGQYNLA
jgi:two-component system phosphate regulon sensor histidine kinase PhoR